jgi:glutamate synthase (NADPH/NADH) small chain
MSDILSEAKRCLNCKNPSCVKGCPVHTDIPNVIQLFLNHKIDEAGEILFKNNPLSAICSLICPHENNCMGNCILGKKDAAIEFHQIENYISRFYLEKTRFKPQTKNGHMVGIIGAGPAGITLSIILALRGFDVTIIDSKDKIGGVLRYGIPEFRLPKSILDTLLSRMKGLGINFRPNTLIGPTVTIDDMFNDGYEAIFIGTGVWKPNRLRIPGETLGNVHFAIDYLKNPDSYDNLGEHVVIIGAGNVAMDAARTILRKTNAKVDIIFNRGEKQVTALNEELRLALVDGVNINYHLNTVKIEKDGIIVEPVTEIKHDNGDIEFINETEKAFKINSTSVIIAIGQGAQSNIVKNTEENINTTKKGLIEASSKGITTREGVFAAGDVVSGARTVVEAVAATKLVADEIENYILNRKK